MEEKRDKRIGKSGHLWLSARRKKRKATAAIAYQQERKKKRLQEHSKIPEENTSTVINKGNEEWSAPSTSRSESGILNLITGTKILQYEENHHNSQDVDLQEVLSEKPVTQTIVRDNLNSKSYTCLQPVSILHESGCTFWERHEDVAELQCPASVPTCGVSEAPQNTQEFSGMSACHVEQCGGLHSSSEDLEKETPVSTVIITNKAHVNNDNEKSLEGNRIVDISFILRKMTELGNHNPAFGCSLNNLKCVNEIRHGLWSVIVLECNMCNGKFSIQTQDPDTSSSHMDINSRAVSGIMSVGGGFSHLQEICASIGMPSMSSKTYSVIHDKICDGWEKAAIKEMQDAAKEEAELAVERGDVDENGTPLLTVAVDGCWSKRSYRTHYNAPSGVAAIVGFYTKKVLFMSVRNKFCYVCARSTSGEDIPKHACYKNWSGSSTSMEANIILEGFQQSEALYNVKYSKMIADGDSSCYKKILEARPYANLTVEKIECRNHLLRNYCTKLRNLSEQHRIGSSSQRKLLLQKILKLRRAVTEAVKHRKSEEMSLREKIALLQADILNGPSHVFGDHSKCCQYFCSGPKEGEKNIVPELKMSELYEHIMKAVKYLAYNSRSLIHDVDSNVVEQFNSIIAKIVGGKRINYALKRSYQGRCSAAVVSHNTKKPHYVLHKTLCDGFSPNKFVKKLELSRSRKREETGFKGKRVKHAIIMKRSKSENPSGLGDANYGPNCERPDMTPDLFQVEKENLLKSLEKTVEERREIERGTLLQAGSGEWLERRRKMLTASKFGRICRRRATTSCKALVKNIIYSSSISSVPAIAYGKKNESIALEQLERQENLVIQQCGLFIDEQLPFLGATPDGLIGEHGLVEIKCPSSAAGIDVDKAVSDGKLGYLMCNDQNKVTRLKTNHDYYYQVQGQLHITNRKFALFAIWTSKDIPIKVVTVQKDDQFWKEKMEKQLTRFYFDCMVPELVDPRYTRNMEIRDPEYIRHIPCKKKGKVSASKNSKDIIMQ